MENQNDGLVTVENKNTEAEAGSFSLPERLTAEAFKDLYFSVSELDVTDSRLLKHEDYDGKIIWESFHVGTCALVSGGVKISFSWQAVGGDKTYEDAHEYSVSLHENDAETKMTGAVLIDDHDGCFEMSEVEVQDFLQEFLKGGEWESMVLAELPRAQEEVVADDEDEDEGGNYEFRVWRDDAPTLDFNGEKIGHAASSDNQAMGGSWSGFVGRWTVLELYKTPSGKFVCSRVEKTKWQGERNRFYAEVCTSEADVIEFFGHGWLAKELYEDAGINDVMVIE